MDLEHLEAFALADDRSEALKQLIPGTEEYYFYHALDHQHAGRLDRVRELVRVWMDRHGLSARVGEIQRRQILLEAAANPKKSLETLCKALNLRFDHQREIE